MPVPQLYAAPRNPDDLTRYAWFNYDHHLQVSFAIQREKGLNVEFQIIYPLPPQQAMNNWLIAHQSWHSQINAILGVESHNLLSVNFSDYAVLEAWAFQHASEHFAWQMATGAA